MRWMRCFLAFPLCAMHVPKCVVAIPGYLSHSSEGCEDVFCEAEGAVSRRCRLRSGFSAVLMASRKMSTNHSKLYWYMGSTSTHPSHVCRKNIYCTWSFVHPSSCLPRFVGPAYGVSRANSTLTPTRNSRLSPCTGLQPRRTWRSCGRRLAPQATYPRTVCCIGSRTKRANRNGSNVQTSEAKVAAANGRF